MAPAVELAIIPLKVDVDVADPATSAGKIWNDTLNTIRNRDGVEKISWGTRVESPDIIDLIIVWRDLQDHESFMADPFYQSFTANLSPIVGGPVQLFHFAPPSPHATGTPLSAPVTEVYFGYTSFSAEKSDFDKAFSEFTSTVTNKAEGFHGFAGGWGVENAKHAAFAEEGGKGRRFVGLLGWQSVDAHIKFRETQIFKEIIPLLRGNVKSAEMHHVHFQHVL